MLPFKGWCGGLGLLAVALVSALASMSCAARKSQPTPVTAPPAPAAEVPAAEAQSGEAATGEAGAPAESPPPVKKRSLSNVCRQRVDAEGVLDETRQRLEESFCSATLWFDGLLGGEPSVTNAREVSGRVELSGLYTEADGFDPKARLRLRYDLPNLKRRFSVFLGRDDEDEFVEDRREGFAIRSSVFGLESEDKWLAGLGYSPPGRYQSKLDFRVGARVKSATEVFVQGRYRRNLFIGDKNVWRFRETVFYENREGFGTTVSADYDRVLSPILMLRWGNVATISEDTDGMSWRTTTLLYHYLGGTKAGAAEVFARGSTGSEVPVREYGARVIYRQTIGKPYLFGSVVGGYTWPRRDDDPVREGSTMVGLGVELHFGQTEE